MKNRLIMLVTASSLTLASCAVGPNYERPATPSTAAGSFVSANNPAVTLAPIEENWWRLYNDPVLDGLIADALKANTDLRVAVANLARARAQLRGSKADTLPRADLAASAQYGRLPAAQRAPGEKREDWVVDAGAEISYEVDAFGRISRGIEAARGDLGAAEADTNAVRVAIVADTARAYVDAASAAERLAVAEHIVSLLDNSVRLTTKRFEAGTAVRLDVARVSALRNQRAADVSAIAAERQAALFRLATLTGRTPQELPEIAGARATTPRLDKPIPVGDGATLLARRPDVRAAEQRLAASTARIGVATADLYPHIQLGASFGSTSNNGFDLFGASPLHWLLGPLISWNFLNQEATRAKIAGAKADSQAALATFDGTVLRALEETETALSNYAHELDRRTALQAARNDAETAVRITRARQREGQIDFLEVLDAERTFADAQADLASADARIADAQIQLFRALGGGWQNAPAV